LFAFGISWTRAQPVGGLRCRIPCVGIKDIAERLLSAMERRPVLIRQTIIEQNALNKRSANIASRIAGYLS
jgi:hypothetical protein